MDVLLVRHARAEDREIFARSGKEDTLRPLTREGRQRFRNSLPALQKLLPEMALIASSPWRRAQQTAELLGALYHLHPEPLDALIPPLDTDGVFAWLNQHASLPGVLALVGHEPDMGQLASRMLCPDECGFMPLKKGGACLLRFADAAGEGQAELIWLLTPAQLRLMSGAA